MGQFKRVVVAIGLVAGGCSSTHFLGDLDGGAGGDLVSSMGGRDGSIAVPGAPRDGGYPGDVSSLGPLQSWTGYVEAYQFPSGSDAVNLSFALDPSGTLVGTAILGAGTPPPPATDPTAAYPPGAEYRGYTPPPIEGFPYTIAGGTMVGSRLRFTIWMSEIWKSWCPLQAPVPGFYQCVPSWGGVGIGNQVTLQGPNGETFVTTEAQLNLCAISDACLCTSVRCDTQPGYGIDLDVALSSDTAGDGAFSGKDFGAHTVRLTKNP